MPKLSLRLILCNSKEDEIKIFCQQRQFDIIYNNSLYRVNLYFLLSNRTALDPIRYTCPMELDGYHVGTSHRTESRFTLVDFISLRFLLNIFNTFPMEKGDRSGFTGECSGKIFNFCDRTVRRIHLQVGNSYRSSGIRSFFSPND